MTLERRIRATSDAVWQAVATPAAHERLDPRFRLESATGEGDVGTQFVLVGGTRAVRARLTYEVREADPPRTWAATVERGGRPAGTQRAELVDEGPTTLLRWTVTLPPGRLTRRWIRTSCERELATWLASVDREASADAG